MAASFVWNTGRFGYGKHLNEHGGGISSERLNHKNVPSYQEVLAQTVKDLIKDGHCNQAFDAIMEADLPYERKVYICQCLLPDLKKCT